MRILPNRTQVIDWFNSNQNGEKDYVFIPEGQANAFIGILAGTANPSIAILDFNQVVRNLMAKFDLNQQEAFDYALDKANNAPHYGPMLIVTYPSPASQPTLNTDDCPF